MPSVRLRSPHFLTTGPVHPNHSDQLSPEKSANRSITHHHHHSLHPHKKSDVEQENQPHIAAKTRPFLPTNMNNSKLFSDSVSLSSSRHSHLHLLSQRNAALDSSLRIPTFSPSALDRSCSTAQDLLSIVEEVLLLLEDTSNKNELQQ